MINAGDPTLSDGLATRTCLVKGMMKMNMSTLGRLVLGQRGKHAINNYYRSQRHENTTINTTDWDNCFTDSCRY